MSRGGVLARDLNDPMMAVIPTLEGRVVQVLARIDSPLSGS